MNSRSLLIFLLACTFALKAYSQPDQAALEVYGYAAVPQIHRDGRAIKTGALFNNYPELYHNAQSALMLESVPFQWQARVPAFVGIRFLALNENSWIHGGLSLETGFLSFKGTKSMTTSGETANLEFTGEELRVNLKANFIADLSPVLIFLNAGFSAGYAKDYQLNFDFANGEEVLIKDDFFRNSDFRFLVGLEAQYYLHKNWAVNLGAEHYALTLYKNASGLPGLNDLYGFRFTSWHLGVVYSIPLSPINH